MESNLNLLEAIEHIDPADLTYEEWVQCGMALKEAGHNVSLWKSWSRKDLSRFHDGECEKKWNSFRGSSTPVTAGTIIQMALDCGWQPPQAEGYAFEWDDIIGNYEKPIIDPGWIESEEVIEPDKWEPKKQLIRYLELLFDAEENVGYVTSTFVKDDRYLPTKGNSDRTAGRLIEELNKCKDIAEVIGDYKEEAGAWIRFNPLDGNGVKNDNVTEFRYALVESDDMPIGEQNAIVRKLELPAVCLVHSGGKSLHAIVRVDAKDYDEYRKRVDYLYSVCKKNGLVIDQQNKNPSRLSRMPGIIRSSHKQFIVAENIGKESWKEWEEWIEKESDDLPEPEGLTEVWDALPPLSPPLIDGVLRQGHKMLLAGPSKAGKSFALIELTIAIAEGKKWIGFDCAKGRILYVNLELDRASCLHRFKDVYNALSYAPNNLKNIDIWNLRGKAIPMDKLAPKLIRRASKKNYIAIVIDPIYKIITGDENSADQMAQFCNQFDLVCHELGAAVIYCHHHSKGTQGQKRSVDRASGSGVFARDPDALLDIIELELTEDIIKQQVNEASCNLCTEYLNEYGPEDWDDKVYFDHKVVASAFKDECKKLLPSDKFTGLEQAIKDTENDKQTLSGWRIDGTLREYKKFPPVNLWFEYPVHRIDDIGVLSDAESDGERPPWVKNLSKKKSAEEKKKERNDALETAISACSIDEEITVETVAEYLGIGDKQVRRRLKEHGGYEVKNSVVYEKK